MDTQTIKLNTALITGRVRRAEKLAGRAPGEVTLLAATKTRTPEEIRAVRLCFPLRFQGSPQTHR